MIEKLKYKLNSNNSEKPSGNPQASVLIAILNYGKFIEAPELIYTQRSGNLSTHSGEVSFPGGKADKTDSNLYETAMRESNEEISLNSEDATKLGKLNYLISRHKIEVNPFVASIDKPQSLKPNEEIQIGSVSSRISDYPRRISDIVFIDRDRDHRNYAQDECRERHERCEQHHSTPAFL